MNDVDKMLVTSAPAKPAARRSSSRRPAAAATPVAETASDAKPTRKRRPMTAEEKKAVSERMTASLGRAQKESREVARRGRGEYVPRPRSVYPSDRRSSEVVPATRRVEPSVDPARAAVASLASPEPAAGYIVDRVLGKPQTYSTTC